MRIGWTLLIAVCAWEAFNYAKESSWTHWSDPRFIALLLLSLCLVVIGAIKRRRREDKYRARFL